MSADPKSLSNKADTAATATTQALSTKSETTPASLPQELASLLQSSFKDNLKSVNLYKIFPDIKIQHGVKKPKFEIGENEELEVIRGVIIRNIIVREYYVNQGNPVPECTSIGGLNGTTHGQCAYCRYNKFENNRKACKEFRKLVMYMPEKETLYEIKVPITSLSNLNTYFKDVMINRKLDLAAVVTKFSLGVKEEKGQKPYSIVECAVDTDISKLDPKHFPKIIQFLKEKDNYYQATEAIGVVQKAQAEPTKQSSATIQKGEGDEVPF